ncbi:MAG: type I 3-dehydroquinate dehydratase [Clostridiales bacterium]|nr:type I 3-dehydroquinate dehydratase [Clostridiales bacterium]
MEKNTVTVRGLELSDHSTRICLPVTARTALELDDQLLGLNGIPYDMLEIRADYYEADAVGELEEVRRRLPDVPLLFTFRTKEEGGEKSIAIEEYANLNRRAAKSGFADLIDLEINRGEVLLQDLCEELQTSGIKVVASFHDFDATPRQEELIRILCRMQTLGADVTKAAVMPHTERDVLTLLSAALAMKEQYADRPYIMMSMGRLGGISRLAGTLTGSAVTFASAKAVSAPGQMDARLVSGVLSVL